MTTLENASSENYQALRRKVKADGLLDSQVSYYWLKAIVAVACLAVGAFLALWFSHPALIAIDAVFMGFASTQAALLAHDIGHRQGFRGKRINAVARLVVAEGVLAINHKWWMAKHSQHHATPNHIDSDPDIQFPMFVFSRDQVRAKWLAPVIRMQAFVLPLLLPLQAINMRFNSAVHLIRAPKKLRGLQVALLVGHVALYGAFLWLLGSWQLAVMFAVIHQATFGLYNSSVFASNHKGMPVISGARPDFVVEQVTTSRNIKSGRFVDFWYGGLNYQIEHHLFPAMPRNNLKKAQVLVREFCKDREIPYHCTGAFEAYREILVHMHEMGRPLRPTQQSL